MSISYNIVFQVLRWWSCSSWLHSKKHFTRPYSSQPKGYGYAISHYSWKGSFWITNSVDAHLMREHQTEVLKHFHPPGSSSVSSWGFLSGETTRLSCPFIDSSSVWSLIINISGIGSQTARNPIHSTINIKNIWIGIKELSKLISSMEQIVFPGNDRSSFSSPWATWHTVNFTRVPTNRRNLFNMSLKQPFGGHTDENPLGTTTVSPVLSRSICPIVHTQFFLGIKSMNDQLMVFSLFLTQTATCLPSQWFLRYSRSPPRASVPLMQTSVVRTAGHTSAALPRVPLVESFHVRWFLP